MLDGINTKAPGIIRPEAPAHDGTNSLLCTTVSVQPDAPAQYRLTLANEIPKCLAVADMLAP